MRLFPPSSPCSKRRRRSATFSGCGDIPFRVGDQSSMATSVVMPALEMAQETGKIVSWLKKEGESVAKGEILLEVETDKAVVEIEAAADGVLAGIKSREGDVVPVGRTIAWLVAPGEQPPVEAPAAAPAARMMTAPPSQSPEGQRERVPTDA